MMGDDRTDGKKASVVYELTLHSRISEYTLEAANHRPGSADVLSIPFFKFLPQSTENFFWDFAM